VRRLVAAYEPDFMYPFGSKARGDSAPDSDYDLMVGVPDGASPRRQRSWLAYEALRGTGTAADILVCTADPTSTTVGIPITCAALARDASLAPTPPDAHEPIATGKEN